MRTRDFAFFSLLLLVASACSAPAAEPTSTQTLEAATSAATLGPSVTPEPTQTPTEATLQLEVVESYQWQQYYTDGITPFAQYIAAIVRNPFDFAVDITGLPTALLFDSTGESVLRTEGAIVFDGNVLGLDQILPGESIGIVICACHGRTTVEFETWQLDFDLKEITPIPVSTDFDVSLDGFEFSNQFGIADAIHGTLRYTGDQPLRGIIVKIFLRDADGKLVAVGALPLLGDRIQGGYANIQPGDTFDLSQGVFVDAALKGQTLIPEVSAIGIVAEQ
jgi:hypothetical protein